MVAVSWLQMFQPPTSNIIRSLCPLGWGKGRVEIMKKAFAQRRQKGIALESITLLGFKESLIYTHICCYAKV